MHEPNTRKSLLIRLRDPAHNEAWREFASIYEPLIYRVAMTKGLQHADAEDMTQEVFTVVGKAIGRFDPDSERGSFRGWLSKITQNIVINFLTRGKEPRGMGDSAIQQLLQGAPCVDEETRTLFQVERQREIFLWAANQIRSQFERDTWQAFWRTGVEGQTIDVVAEQLGKSAGAVRIARCRVLARLKREVHRFEE